MTQQQERTLHYSASLNEDGKTYYINRYFKDEYGDTRKQTVYDGLTEKETVRLIDTLENHKEQEFR